MTIIIMTMQHIVTIFHNFLPLTFSLTELVPFTRLFFFRNCAREPDVMYSVIKTSYSTVIFLIIRMDGNIESLTRSFE